MGDAPLKGQVVKAGQHDELGASRWLIVRSADDVEHFARLKLGQTAAAVGRQVELSPTPKGAQIDSLGRGSDLSRG